MKSIVSLITIFFFYFSYSQSLTNISEKDFVFLQEKTKSCFSTNIDSAYIFANKIDKSNVDLHKAFAKSAKAYIFQLKGDTIQSNNNLSKSFLYLRKSDNSDFAFQISSNVYNFAGLINWKRGNLVKALNYFEKGKAFSLKIDDKIQVFKFQDNMALVFSDLGKYEKSIKMSKESDKLTNDPKIFINSDYYRYKSNLYYNLGIFYQKFYKEYSQSKHLDSSYYYFNKTLNFSTKFIEIKTRAKKSIGIIDFSRNDYFKAEKQFLSSMIFAKEHNMIEEFGNINYNLGVLYFNQDKNEKALVCFKRLDSIHQKSNILYNEYLYSNYYQSIIFDKKSNYKEVEKHTSIFLEYFEKYKDNLSKQEFEINYKLANKDIENEITILRKKNETRNTFKLIISMAFVAIILAILYLLFKNINEKKKAIIKINNLIDEFKNKKEFVEEFPRTKANSLNLDDEKENEIYEKLKNLEAKKFFLNEDFNQQNVAKKIKTNTTYLSYVVNKRFGKTFSEYSNELKINFLINDLINNPKTRKYSTQAMAESVGFKNASSFTISFKKRTGVSPVQFINQINQKD